ncbi:MAG: FtsX-like permease family protein [Tannerellaceae bacterium]
MILKQLWNRSRSNSWIFIELLLIFCLLWYMVDYFFVLGYNKSMSSSRDLDHTWQVDVALLPEDHPEYQPGESDSIALEANYSRLLDRIRQSEEVEALAVFSQFASPGGGGYMGNTYRSVEDTSRTANGMNLSFDPREDYFRVFGYVYPDGKPVSVHDFDWDDPKAVVVGRLVETSLFPTTHAIGQQIETQDGKDQLIIKGVIGDIKRFDYLRYLNVYYTPRRATFRNISQMCIAVRSKATRSDEQFLLNFNEQMISELRIGNFYLKSVKSYNQITADTDNRFGQTRDVRVRTAMLLFFLVNILLCVMGTFWYRIRMRREEIGLRMAMGASRSSIRRMLFVEGLCLLTAAMLPALLIEVQFIQAGLIDTMGRYDDNTLSYLPDRMGLRFILTNGLTWLLLAVTVVAAIWFPATKAAKMKPTDALHNE